MKNIWRYGTSKPTQRVGLIILLVGILSYSTWVFFGHHYGYDYTYANVWIDVVLDPDYFPKNRDFLFFHLYFYLIPVGLVMTWGYGLVVKLKSWIMGENKKQATNPEILHFKDNEAAFEMACEYMNTDISLGSPMVAIAVQSKINENELNAIMIKVADTSPFHTYASIKFTLEHPIENGALLGIVPYEKNEDESISDDRKRWLFAVVSELNPRYHLTKQMWSIKKDFIKEAVAREKS